MQIVTLLTDFGVRDYYVGAVKGTLLRLTREPLQLVDLTHEIEPGAIATGAFVLGAAWETFPSPTVHLVVVDPGVGSDRRILVVDRDGHRFVGPDNGVLEPVLDEGRILGVERSDLYLEFPGATFHGRDRFAPVAAALVRGEPIDELGPEIDDPVRLDTLDPRRDGDHLRGRVVHVDRFGNLVTNIPAEWLEGVERARTWIGAHHAERIVSHYDELDPGEAGLLVGSLGTLEISLPGESLAATWNVSPGDPVEVRWSLLEEDSPPE
ncbi:MAG: SAM-dependent chlorinase/fluorinase [Thermoanaerobaculia bacterium]|nr:SAM-dependent chlorinase/fluorinase [Thermoanaerobaculia bacterium]